MFKLTLITVESCLDGYFNDTTISFGVVEILAAMEARPYSAANGLRRMGR